MSESFNGLIKKYPDMEDDIEELRLSVKNKTEKGFTKVMVGFTIIILVVYYLRYFL